MWWKDNNLRKEWEDPLILDQKLRSRDRKSLNKKINKQNFARIQARKLKAQIGNRMILV